MRWAAVHDTVRVALLHDVDRIEAMDSGAVLIGTNGVDLRLSTLRLGRGAPVFVDGYTIPGETRSHGFFYHPDGDGAAVLGLPVHSTERPSYMGSELYPSMAKPPDGPPLFLGPTRIRFLRSHGPTAPRWRSTGTGRRGARRRELRLDRAACPLTARSCVAMDSSSQWRAGLVGVV